MKTKKIKLKDLKVGMKIKSYDENTHEAVYRPVTNVWNTTVPVTEQRHLKFENGTELHCSQNHPILTLKGNKLEQTYPDELTKEHTVVQESGGTKPCSVKSDNQPVDYVDITVGDTHTFFASNDPDSEMILTHNSQGGIRGASSTVYFIGWHYEVEDLLVLKNNKGTEETRIRHMDYAIQLNGYLYRRLIESKDITLFSPNDVPGLYDSFFENQELFAELYEQYEINPNIRKKSISALDLFSLLLTERNNTGRIYIHHVDHSNNHGAFVPSLSPVRMSNLCTEILLPTEPLTRLSNNQATEEDFELSVEDFRSRYGEIALCTLSSINLGAVKTPEEFDEAGDLSVRALDELLDYQSYPMVAAEVPAINRRSLGIGVCNLAYVIAKNGFKYSDGSANQLINDIAEQFSFSLIKASVNLAKEKGSCKWFETTKYSQGHLPIDTYKSAIDDCIPDCSLKCDWEGLRSDLRKYGMRNSTVMALMPVESSSQLVNATNGIEPPRSPVSLKTSKDGVLKQVVPSIRQLKNKYEYLWDMPNTRGYLEIAGIFQKWIDQSISANTHYEPSNYEDGNVPMSELIRDLVYSYKLGISCLYYQNTNDGSGEVDWDRMKNEEEECLSCKL